MAHSNPFEQHAQEYDEWFERHQAAYEAELCAVRAALPTTGQGLEVGVGSGRFAARLGVQMGVDPSPSMVALARARGVQARIGRAEALPFSSEQFDFVLMVTAICFIDDLPAAFREVVRVLKSNGTFVVAFLDPDTPLGKQYLKKKTHDRFYREARFYAYEEVVSLLRKAGLSPVAEWQTVFALETQATESMAVRPGHGEGGFVVLRAEKTPAP